MGQGEAWLAFVALVLETRSSASHILSKWFAPEPHPPELKLGFIFKLIDFSKITTQSLPVFFLQAPFYDLDMKMSQKAWSHKNV